MLFFWFLALISCSTLSAVEAAKDDGVNDSTCYGCVELSNYTLEVMVKRKYPYVLVKFDVAFPYGELHEAFVNYANELGQTPYPVLHDDIKDRLLVGMVGIKDYGSETNLNLAKRFNWSGDMKRLPFIRLFTNHKLDKWIEYPTNKWTKHSLVDFIISNTDLIMQRPDSLPAFDELAEQYIRDLMEVARIAKKNINSKPERKEQIERGHEQTKTVILWEKYQKKYNELFSKESDELTVDKKLYWKQMKRISESKLPLKEYFKHEEDRLKKLMDSKMSENNMESVRRNWYIFKVFLNHYNKINNPPKKKCSGY